jgi:hypothetical protein
MADATSYVLILAWQEEVPDFIDFRYKQFILFCKR